LYNKGDETMTRIESLNISFDELRSLTLEALKNNEIKMFTDICNEVANLTFQREIVPNSAPGGFGQTFSLVDKDIGRVSEIVWDLIVERVLTIGWDASNPAWPFLRLTEYGKLVVKEQHPTPHDPSGYLCRLQSEIPTLDPIIIDYLNESLTAYRINLLLSSTITLGCASEKAMLILIESFCNAIQDATKKTAFTGLTNGKMISRQFDEFKKRVFQCNIPTSITNNLENDLVGIFQMIRNYRNDTGHPTGIKLNREQVYANLMVFISYCKKVYSLIDYLNINKIDY
jgi:hypothetical protein